MHKVVSVVMRDLVVPKDSGELLCLGYKVIQWDPEISDNQNLRQAFLGQTNFDWSATYLNSSVETALGYVPTKLESSHTIALIKIFLINDAKICIPNAKYFADCWSSDEFSSDMQATSLKAAIRQVSAIDVSNSSNLLETLGRHGYILLTTDTKGVYEIAVPHSFLFESLSIQCIATISSTQLNAYVPLRQPNLIALTEGDVRLPIPKEDADNLWKNSTIAAALCHHPSINDDLHAIVSS